MNITSRTHAILPIAIIAATALTLLATFTSVYATNGILHHHHDPNLKCTPTLIHLTDQSVTSIQYLCKAKSLTTIVHLPNSIAIG